MNKSYVDSLQQGVRTLAANLDMYWCLTHHPEVPATRQQASFDTYHGMVQALTCLGGDFVRDEHGRHRVFLAGMSSRRTDEYNKED